MHQCALYNPKYGMYFNTHFVLKAFLIYSLGMFAVINLLLTYIVCIFYNRIFFNFHILVMNSLY